MSTAVPRMVRRALCRAQQRSSTTRQLSTITHTTSCCSPSHLLAFCSNPISFPSRIHHPSLHPTTSHPLFSTSAKRPVPSLNATLRRFYFLVHPDLFHSHPHHRAVNELSMQHFLGFITAMKQTSSDQPWPLAQHTNLTFYIRRKPGDRIDTALSFIQHNEHSQTTHNTSKPHHKQPATPKRKPQAKPAAATDADFHELRLTLSTNGGNCRSLVERQLRHLFAMLALPQEFKWDDEYWQTKPPIKRGGAGEEEGDDEYEYA